MRGRNMATGLEARTLKQLVEPLLQVGELGEVDTSPFCRDMLVWEMR